MREDAAGAGSGGNRAAHLAAQELFDRTADDYRARSQVQVADLTSLVFARRKEVVLSLLDGSGAQGTLLDFGMGPGVFAADAVERGLDFVGIDISEAMVERARALGLPNATYVRGDLEALDPYRGAVDVVLAIGLIDYLEDPEDGLRRLVACLRPDGVLIVSFRNRLSVNTFLRAAAKAVWRRLFSGARWREKSAFVSAVHERSFTPGELRRSLAGLGMDDFHVRYHNVTPGLFVNVPLRRGLWNLWRRADRIVARPVVSWACDAGVLRCRRRP